MPFTTFFYNLATHLWSLTGWPFMGIMALFIVAGFLWAAYWEWRELRDMANEEHRKHREKHGL